MAQGVKWRTGCVVFLYITPYKNNSTRKNMSRNPPTPGIPGAPKLAEHPSPVDPMGFFWGGQVGGSLNNQKSRRSFLHNFLEGPTFRRGTSVTWAKFFRNKCCWGRSFL